MKTLVVLQPGYLPWLGFFDQLDRSDVFVYYDDVQFDKEGWRNRNRIKSQSGATWLTVPVLHGGRFGQKIKDVEIDNRQPWARKHLATISQAYARAPFRQQYLPELAEVLSRRFDSLVELDIILVDVVCRWLGLERRIERASRLGVEGGQSERLLRLCQHFEATRYLSGDSAKDYLDLALFEGAGVKVDWQSFRHPTYSQLHGEFVPYLSIVDLVFNMGPRSLDVVREQS